MNMLAALKGLNFRRIRAQRPEQVEERNTLQIMSEHSTMSSVDIATASRGSLKVVQVQAALHRLYVQGDVDFCRMKVSGTTRKVWWITPRGLHRVEYYSREMLHA